MRSEVVGIILAILVTASLGIGYLAGSSGSHTETLTSTSTATSRQTVFSSTIVEKTITSTITSTVLTGQPIPVASIETANTTIGGAPRTVAVNPNTSRIYVTDYFSKNLTVIDARSHSVLARITLPANNSNGIAIDYNTNTIYVLVEGGVAEINGSTNKVVGELPLDFGPGSLAYDPSTHIIYGSPETVGGPQQTPRGSLIGADVRTGSIVANISLGYWANSVALDPTTHMVYAAGCANSFVCGSEVAVVNGTSETLVITVHLNSAAYPRVTVDPKTNVVYVSGSYLTALNGTSGKVIYSVNPLECSPYDSMVAISSSNQLAAISPAYNYLFAYDGASGTLVNMYSLSSTPESVAFNPNTGEFYVTLWGGHQAQLVSFPMAVSTGSVDSALVGSGQHCGLP
jgi:DNA-binding beta-propeller fold protein YncE